MHWEPLRIDGGPHFIGPDPRDESLNRYGLDLSREPEREWAAEITRQQLDTHVPIQVVTSGLIVVPGEGQLREYVEYAHRRVKDANRFYTEQVIPQIERKKQASERRQTEETERVRRAQEEAAAIDLSDFSDE